MIKSFPFLDNLKNCSEINETNKTFRTEKWSTREMASVALSAERDTLRTCFTCS